MVLNPVQYGFRPGRSGEDMLIELVDELTQTVHNNAECTGVAFLDATKAFGIVNHTLLGDALLHGFNLNLIYIQNYTYFMISVI